MNVNKLNAFYHVAKRGSFTAAAQFLRVSQPALSIQVRSLETHYGVELLYRRPRSVDLTPTGQKLFSLSEHLFGLVEQAEAILSEASQSVRGVLRVGADSPYQVISMLKECRMVYPEINFHVSFGNSLDIATGLREFKTDVALLSQHHSDPQFYSLLRRNDPLVAFVSTSHRWAKKTRVHLESFQGEETIRRESGSNTQRAFNALCESRSIQPNYVLEIGSREALREAVAEGLGVGVIPKSELGSDVRLVAIPICNVSLELEESVVCLKTRKDAPLIRAFLDLVHKV